MKLRCFSNFIKDNNGQAILEYLIVSAAILLGFLLINDIFIPPLNELYNAIVSIIRHPAL